MFASTNGGFRKSRYPIAGLFISRKTPSTKWMMTGGYPHDSGNLHEQLGDDTIVSKLFLNNPYSPVFLNNTKYIIIMLLATNHDKPLLITIFPCLLFFSGSTLLCPNKPPRGSSCHAASLARSAVPKSAPRRCRWPRGIGARSGSRAMAVSTDESDVKSKGIGG